MLPCNIENHFWLKPVSVLRLGADKGCCCCSPSMPASLAHPLSLSQQTRCCQWNESALAAWNVNRFLSFLHSCYAKLYRNYLYLTPLDSQSPFPPGFLRLSRYFHHCLHLIPILRDFDSLQRTTLLQATTVGKHNIPGLLASSHGFLMLSQYVPRKTSLSHLPLLLSHERLLSGLAPILYLVVAFAVLSPYP